MPQVETRRQDVRNIAIIAHVDHGKTTLVDAMLRQTGEFHVKPEDAQETVLDYNPLERERGITILAKCTSIPYEGHTINIVDTPGHADFGSEVERILKMVDGALLLVDAVDGPMPQTKFVLRKALQLGLSPIVVINKMDRPHIRPHQVLDDVFSLFIDLGATDPQLDFPVLYAAGKDGWASTDAKLPSSDLKPLFKTILQHVPGPLANSDKPLQMLVTMLDHNNFVGKIGIGRIVNGGLRKGQAAVIVKPDGRVLACKINRLERFVGLARQEVDSAQAGDIVAVAGLEDVTVGDTLAHPENPKALPALDIEEPTLSMEFMVNDSPFAGTEGKFVTSRHVKARLLKEQQTNVGLKIEELPGEGKFKVSGRGELHLSVLIETMRREGFELAVSRPEVIFKEEGGKKMEPTEYLVIDSPKEYQGAIFDNLGRRSAKMKDMKSEGAGRLLLEYVIPSRSLIGFKSEFLTMTRGNGIMHHSFNGYAPKEGDSMARQKRRHGRHGKGNDHGLCPLQFAGPRDHVPGARRGSLRGHGRRGKLAGQRSRGQSLQAEADEQHALESLGRGHHSHSAENHDPGAVHRVHLRRRTR